MGCCPEGAEVEPSSERVRGGSLKNLGGGIKVKTQTTDVEDER